MGERMEFLKFVRKKSFLSELIYTILNIGLAVGILLIVAYTEAVWFAIVLVVLSKWRVFAVRPRYWWANLRSNMVDFIVGVSIVLHMYTINAAAIDETTKLLLLIVMTIVYIVWLLFIKPRSKRAFVATQAGVAVFLGMSALFTISYNWPVSIVVAAAWLIGYSSARHILSTYDEETHALFLALAWGLIVAEVSWVSYHWAIAYPLPIVPALMLPQAALAVTLISFLTYKSYDSFYHHAKIRMNDILLPLLFTVSVLVVLLVVFNRVGTAI
jgi:hypothetical protein